MADADEDHAAVSASGRLAQLALRMGEAFSGRRAGFNLQPAASSVCLKRRSVMSRQVGRMSHSIDSKLTADSPGASCLLVEAGGKRLACAFSVVLEVGRAQQITPVPGGRAWLVGLIQWRGRLLTVLDAGRLFGYRPCQARKLVVLTGLRVDTALIVDSIVGTDDQDGTADLVLDAEALAAHPALQPGAAASEATPNEAA